MTTAYRYIAGTRCLNCHTADPAARGLCKNCYSIRYKEGTLPKADEYRHLTIRQCKQGHLIEGDNEVDGGKEHFCRICRNTRSRAEKARARARKRIKP